VSVVRGLRASMRGRLRGERGWVVVTAIIVMTIMVGVGLAVLATVDTQSAQSRRERVRESLFNMAEGLLEAESGVLQNNWPTSPPCAGNAPGCGYQWSAADPDTCTNGNAPFNQCPDPPTIVGLTGAFSNVDQSLGSIDWRIQVRDDVGVGTYYTNGQIPNYFKGTGTSPPGDDQVICRDSTNALVACSWDDNGNNQLWVRVDASIGTGASKRTRSMVALLHLEHFPVNFAINAVAGGAINFGNNGNKSLVDATDSKVIARCQPSTGPDPGSGTFRSTTLVDPTSGQTQLSPGHNTAYVDSTAGFSQGDVVAVGLSTADQTSTNYELFTIANGGVLSGPPRLVFTNNAGSPASTHITGEQVQIAPNKDTAVNNCETWIGPNEPGASGADKHQLDPARNYISDPNYPNAMDLPTLTAVEKGLPRYGDPTANPGCPVGLQWNGNLVIKNAPAAGCTMQSGTYNSEGNPHFIIVENQTGGCGANPALTISSNVVYWGVIYMVNRQNCGYTGQVLFLNAGAQIGGGVTVDGHGQVAIGSAQGGSNCTIPSQNNTCPVIVFKKNSFSAFGAAGAAGLVQNTWRELAPGQ
jgi:hypothetical protein